MKCCTRTLSNLWHFFSLSLSSIKPTRFCGNRPLNDCIINKDKMWFLIMVTKTMTVFLTSANHRRRNPFWKRKGEIIMWLKLFLRVTVLTETSSLLICSDKIQKRSLLKNPMSAFFFLSLYGDESAGLTLSCLDMNHRRLLSRKPVSFDKLSPAGWKMVSELQHK